MAARLKRAIPMLARWLPGAGLLAASLLATTGCGDTPRPATYVENLRVLAVTIEPPDLAPGQAATLDALVVDPRDPARKNTLLWLACDPDPRALQQSACASFDALAEPEQLAAAAQDGGIRILGMGREVGYTAPPALFAGLGPDDLHRRKGVLAVVMLLVVAEELTDFDALPALLQKVKLKQVDSVIALKRVRISEDEPLNQNPRIAALRLDDQTWAPGLRPLKVVPGVTYTLTGIAEEGAAEHYVALNADDQPEEHDEKPIFSWFATAGTLDQPRSPAGEALQKFTAPFTFDPVPPGRNLSLYAVLRDGRGGAATTVRGMFVCDFALAAPLLDLVEPGAAKAGTRLSIAGRNLENVLDVEVGGKLLSLGRLDPGTGRYEGFLSSELEPGTHRLLVRGKGCGKDPEATVEITAP